MDDLGLTNSMDFVFDEWDKVKVPSCWNTEKEKFFTMKEVPYTREPSSIPIMAKNGFSLNSEPSTMIPKSF